jgi:hypothetical protein
LIIFYSDKIAIKEQRKKKIKARTVNSTSDYKLWALYRSYYKGISANIELQLQLTVHIFSPKKLLKIFPRQMGI